MDALYWLSEELLKETPYGSTSSSEKTGTKERIMSVGETPGDIEKVELPCVLRIPEASSRSSFLAQLPMRFIHWIMYRISL
jgi:hypothetical protein